MHPHPWPQRGSSYQQRHSQWRASWPKPRQSGPGCTCLGGKRCKSTCPWNFLRGSVVTARCHRPLEREIQASLRQDRPGPLGAANAIPLWLKCLGHGTHRNECTVLQCAARTVTIQNCIAARVFRWSRCACNFGGFFSVDHGLIHTSLSTKDLHWKMGRAPHGNCFPMISKQVHWSGCWALGNQPKVMQVAKVGRKIKAASSEESSWNETTWNKTKPY